MKSESFEGVPGLKSNNLSQSAYPIGSGMGTAPNSIQGDATKSMGLLGWSRVVFSPPLEDGVWGYKTEKWSHHFYYTEKSQLKEKSTFRRGRRRKYHIEVEPKAILGLRIKLHLKSVLFLELCYLSWFHSGLDNWSSLSGPYIWKIHVIKPTHCVHTQKGNYK